MKRRRKKEKNSPFLEEWKINNDLFKYHEDLKQKRFTYFLTLQTAFLALFGLVFRSMPSNFRPEFFIVLILIPIPPLFFTYYISHLDSRARAYIDTIKTKLLLIENEWEINNPTGCFSTYTEQFEVLVHKKEKTIRKYLEIRKINNDEYKELLNSGAAYVRESKIISMFKILWIALLVLSLAFAALNLLCSM